MLIGRRPFNSGMRLVMGAAAVAAVPAFASASIVTAGATFPTLPSTPSDNPNVVGTVDATSVTNGARGLSAGRVERQSFVVTSAITVGSLYFSAANLNAGQTVDVSFVTTTDTNAKPLVDGTQVASLSFVVPVTQTAQTTLEVDLSALEQFTLPAPDTSTNPNAGYIMLVQQDAADTAVPMNMLHSNNGTDRYTYGRYRRDDGDQTNTRDFGFAMTAATTSAPEPASLSVLGLAGAALLVRRRR